MAGGTNVGWQLFGTVLCGLVFAIPIILVYFIVKWIMSSVEKRKAKVIKDHTVV
ncbi:MAG TPA: hypothetical protein VMX55_02685 [candidate division Zixibacteria bacterium]|nr:hypothetical protein [candidate division Zixibacteria bacterium]